jgi:sugar phosphate permease
VRNYGEAFRNRNVIILCLQYFAWSIGVYGFVLWLPSILRNGTQMGMVEAGWLSAVPYLAATIAMVIVSWASDKTQNRKLFVWPLLLIGALAFLGSYLVGSNHFWMSYTLLVIAGAAMYAPYGPFFAIIPEMLPRNVAGGAMALINSMGALGSFIGSWIVGYLNGATGSPSASYIFMGSALLVSVWLTLIVKPAQARWMSDAEKAALQAELQKEQENIKAVRNYSEAFRNRNVIILCLQYFAWSIGVYGFVLWLPSILRNGTQMGMVEAGWLSAVPYLAATIAMVVVSWASDKTQNRKLFVWPLLLVGALAFLGSYLVGSNNFWMSYTLLVIAGAAMYAPYGPFFAIIPEMLPRNVAGGAMALINSMGALGSFIGSWIVGYLNGATGSPSASYIFMGSALLVSVWLTLIVKPAQNKAPPLQGAKPA